ncbi:hypothetical protein M1771_07735 [Spiroplasma citri]|uniref:Transmembrane protein n=1 Tax=Spiroplasma citri TaxID=2133 RepID=A0AAX3SXW4_SPICI|nr:hypothetical protein [Spiroplasma citri]WFG95992.1 hypothetical protein M0C40_07775 [Spiroplasma citri]WFG99881.1 hypothetical protein M1771_07735 [Spiroplasma citri]
MNLLHEWSNFKIVNSTSFFFNPLLERIAIIFLTNFVLCYLVLKIVKYFFAIYTRKNETKSLATRYFFMATFAASEFIVLLILQIILLQIYASKTDTSIYLSIVLVLQFFITIIILINKQFLNYILKLVMSVLLSLLFSFLITKQLWNWIYYVNNNHILVLWLIKNISIIFIITFIYLFDLKTTFLHDFAFQILTFLILINNFENGSADLKILDRSLFFKIILKIIKVLCLLDLFFLIKTVKKTMKNLLQINDDNSTDIVALLLLLNNIRFFNISEKNALENLPNKFLKNEINGWRRILQE